MTIPNHKPSRREIAKDLWLMLLAGCAVLMFVLVECVPELFRRKQNNKEQT